MSGKAASTEGVAGTVPDEGAGVNQDDLNAASDEGAGANQGDLNADAGSDVDDSLFEVEIDGRTMSYKQSDIERAIKRDLGWNASQDELKKVVHGYGQLTNEHAALKKKVDDGGSQAGSGDGQSGLNVGDFQLSADDLTDDTKIVDKFNRVVEVVKGLSNKTQLPQDAGVTQDQIRAAILLEKATDIADSDPLLKNLGVNPNTGERVAHQQLAIAFEDASFEMKRTGRTDLRDPGVAWAWYKGNRLGIGGDPSAGKDPPGNKTMRMIVKSLQSNRNVSGGGSGGGSGTSLEIFSKMSSVEQKNWMKGASDEDKAELDRQLIKSAGG